MIRTKKIFKSSVYKTISAMAQNWDEIFRLSSRNLTSTRYQKTKYSTLSGKICNKAYTKSKIHLNVVAGNNQFWLRMKLTPNIGNRPPSKGFYIDIITLKWIINWLKNQGFWRNQNFIFRIKISMRLWKCRFVHID